MSHGDSVTDSNRGEYNRCSSCHSDAHFYRLHDLIQIHMSWHDLIVGAYNSYKWPFHLFLCNPKRVH